MSRHRLAHLVIFIFRFILVVLAGPLMVAPAAWPQTAGSGPSPGQTSSQVQLRSHLEQGTEAMRNGDNSSAAEDFRGALAIDPHSLAALNNLGIVLSRLGQPGEAIPLYVRALAVRPHDPTTSRNLAIAYFKTQRYAPAWQLLRPLAVKYPNDFQILDLAGLSLFALDRYLEAAQYLERASRLQTSDLETLDMLGKAYLRTKNYKALTDVFARIMRLNPESASAHVLMATADEQMDKKPDAVKEYLAAQTSDTHFMGVHSGLGLLYSQQGETEAAEKEFRAELSTYPTDPISNCLLGEILVNKSQAAEAKPYFQAALKVNPVYAEALVGLGKAELAMNNPAAAIDPLRKAIRLDPNEPKAHFVLGSVLRKLGRTAEAVKEQKIALDIQEKHRAEYMEDHKDD
jgi:tetratricopeptide (TPR) repeat protein